MKYTTDGSSYVKYGKAIIAKSYLGNDGKYEVRVLQGVDRLAVLDKIRVDCPAFIVANQVPDNYYPKLFSK